MKLNNLGFYLIIAAGMWGFAYGSCFLVDSCGLSFSLGSALVLGFLFIGIGNKIEYKRRMAARRRSL